MTNESYNRKRREALYAQMRIEWNGEMKTLEGRVKNDRLAHSTVRDPHPVMNGRGILKKKKKKK